MFEEICAKLAASSVCDGGDVMAGQELPTNWVSTAANQLTSDSSGAGGGPGGDLITKGLTTASFTNVGLAAAAGTVGTVLVTILGNFKDKPTLAIAAAVIIAGVSFSIACIVGADLNSRAKVNSARLQSVGLVVGREVSLASSQAATPSLPAAQAGSQPPQTFTAAVPIVGFDVGSDDAPQHLLAVAWTATAGQTPSNVIYLVADEARGAPAWTTEIFGVQRVKLAPRDA